ncbi:hypothetical protein C6P44_003458 [Monosporozyma unispora]|nr:hypothetical protein C6P44_003458 [Kazachstania unispora]
MTNYNTDPSSSSTGRNNDLTNNNNNSNNNNNRNKYKYKKKWFYKDEWIQKCEFDKYLNNPKLKNNYSEGGGSNNKYLHSTDKSIHERSLPILLLNYFIIYGYEEASIRMAKELNIIQNNLDITHFNQLFMIKERNQIKNLILSGKITQAITHIDELFGLTILQDHEDEDLYFKLTLLNLIEMIRNKSYGDDISKLIQYTRTHLAAKASQSRQYMSNLQSVISLLMLTAASTTPLDIKSLPTNLQNLYSIKLRNKLAHSINMKFLQVINIKVSNQTKFPNLILSGHDSILSPNNNNNNNSLKHILKHGKEQMEGEDNFINDKSPSVVSESYNPTITDRNKYWQETKKYLNLNGNESINNTTNDDNLDNSPFEAKLVQLMKLWIYSENELHSKGYGIPRVEDNLTSSN